MIERRKEANRRLISATGSDEKPAENSAIEFFGCFLRCKRGENLA